MKAYLCDRCGAVINPVRSGTAIQIEPHDMGKECKEIVLCVSCAFYLRQWLNNTDPFPTPHTEQRKVII